MKVESAETHTHEKHKFDNVDGHRYDKGKKAK
jgi:hypothetical protein